MPTRTNSAQGCSRSDFGSLFQLGGLWVCGLAQQSPSTSSGKGRRRCHSTTEETWRFWNWVGRVQGRDQPTKTPAPIQAHCFHK